jgi:hypothetical protein
METAFGVSPYKWQEYTFFSSVEDDKSALRHTASAGISMPTDRRWKVFGSRYLHCYPRGYYLVHNATIVTSSRPESEYKYQDCPERQLRTRRPPRQVHDGRQKARDLPSPRHSIRSVVAVVVVLCSPQAFSNRDIYRLLFKKLCDNNKLSLLCIVEVHLFVQLGLFFRKEFIALFEHVFHHLVPRSTAAQHDVRARSAIQQNNQDAIAITKKPVLFMTATSTQTILDQLRRIPGYTFLRQHVFWPGADGMMKATVRLVLNYTTQSMGIFKTSIAHFTKSRCCCIHNRNRR